MLTEADIRDNVLPTVALNESGSPVHLHESAKHTFTGLLGLLADQIQSHGYVHKLASQSLALVHRVSYPRSPAILLIAGETNLQYSGYFHLNLSVNTEVEFRADYYLPRYVLPEDLWVRTRDNPVGQILGLVQAMLRATAFANGAYSETALKREVGTRSDDLLLGLIKEWGVPPWVLAGTVQAKRLLDLQERYPDGTRFDPLPVAVDAVAPLTRLPLMYKDRAKDKTHFLNSKPVQAVSSTESLN